jgi:hypothetical protein
MQLARRGIAVRRRPAAIAPWNANALHFNCELFQVSHWLLGVQRAEGNSAWMSPGLPR